MQLLSSYLGFIAAIATTLQLCKCPVMFHQTKITVRHSPILIFCHTS